MKKELMIVGLCGLIAGLSLAGSYWFSASKMHTYTQQQDQITATHSEKFTTLRKQIAQLNHLLHSVAQADSDKVHASNSDESQLELIFEQLKVLKQDYRSLEGLVNYEIKSNQQRVLNDLPGEKQLSKPVRSVKTRGETAKATEEKFQIFHNELLAEEIDSQWSVPATEMLESAVNSFIYEQPDANLLIHDIDCRATMCRLDLGLDGGVVKAEEFHMSLLTQLGSQIDGLQRKKQMDANGSVRSVYYLKRKG